MSKYREESVTQNTSDLYQRPHRRYNPLTGEWILVSPHRTNRPWQGQEEIPPREEHPVYDQNCYLCPGNERAGGAQNPDYDETFVFTNDFAALLPDTPDTTVNPHSLMRAEGVRGTCRVLCFSPRHDRTLAEMDAADIRTVVDLWVSQLADLSEYRWVQIFENRGEMMGASNPHPHGQIWAGDMLPREPAKEDTQQHAYLKEHGTPLLIDYAELETEAGTRIVVENDDWLVVVPYWAIWPFETLVLPRRHVLRLTDLTDTERNSLADVLKRMLIKFDNLFNVSFPYSMGWHNAPNDEADYEHWQLHAHFYPPLLRSATVRKFMVGFEMLGEPQRDLTAEQAAARLRALSETHFTER